MTKAELYDVWWNDSQVGEQPMEDNHRRHWEKVLSMVKEEDLGEYSVFDFGCNQGGFLRFLYGQRPFKLPVGYINLQEEDSLYQSIADRMQYEYEQAYIFRFVAPQE
ncbi:MAG: hypothetical protein AB2421_11135 [Thermotaleaceae bacterium]